MSYYHIQSDIYAELRVITAFPEIPDPESIHGDDLYFLSGERISAPIPNPLEFEVDCVNQAPHLLEDQIPVMSLRLAKAFAEFGIDNFQFYPAVLRNPETGVTWRDYVAFNVIGCVDAVDRAASTFTTIMDGDEGGAVTPLLDYQQLVFSQTKLNGHEMFRLYQNHCLYVSERILMGLRARKPEGGWGFSATKIEVR
jgi:hypothetical protein